MLAKIPGLRRLLRVALENYTFSSVTEYLLCRISFIREEFISAVVENNKSYTVLTPERIIFLIFLFYLPQNAK